MNAHLAERLGTAAHHHEGMANQATIGSRPNNDIRDYFRGPREPRAPPTSSWLEKPEIPTHSEFLPQSHPASDAQRIIDVNDGPEPNKVKGPHQGKEDYLRSLYNLAREDAIRPLRDAIEQVRRSPWQDESDFDGASGSLGLYEPVYLTSIIAAGRGLGIRMAFSLGRAKKHIRWEQSKRLITGSLVALSPVDDCFQSKCVLAVVAARPMDLLHQNPPEIDLFFARAEEIEVDPMKRWIMVESRSSFFEASRHTLLALQHMMQEPFPLSEHLVKVQADVEPPKYVQTNPYTDMSSLVSMEDIQDFRNVNILEDWPSNESHGLDASQSNALKQILTSRLAIVQGPPGTGKTYVSVVALKILLSNLAGLGEAPIIVTCQTNHALDQLLRHVYEFEKDFIRLGGRSKDNVIIKKRTLFEVRQGMSEPRHPQGGRSVFARLRQVTSAMEKLLWPLMLGNSPIDHKILVKFGIITAEQGESIEAINAMGMSTQGPDTYGLKMEQWLGKCVTPCLRPLQPEDFADHEEDAEDYEIEKLQEIEAEAQDDSLDTLKGTTFHISDNVMGRSGALLNDEQIETILRTDDLTTVPISHRGPIYNYFQRKLKQKISVEFRKLAVEYEKFVKERRIHLWEQDLEILKSQRLVGMTTTGLSKYRALISALKPKVVLVEEAAETLEPPVTAACLPSLEHLILVGDHQQLRPHCETKEFEGKPFNFNVSLFERMVKNKVQMSCLTRQRRMLPEIRSLLTPIYGNILEDHPSVKDTNNRPPVEGMGTDTFFFTHEWEERQDALMSYVNPDEAKMIIGLVNYLMLNGVEASKITILTFYNGQRKEIFKQLCRHENLRGHTFTIVTVDSYQGEENDIVLLSLVRSNDRRKIGFLDVINRVCVALSRARRGFYLFGDAEGMAVASDLWGEVVKIMCNRSKIEQGCRPPRGQPLRVGYFLPLQCVTHKRKWWIGTPEDWNYINGGCDEKCCSVLPCGHNCTLFCHPFSHDQINCMQNTEWADYTIRGAQEDDQQYARTARENEQNRADFHINETQSVRRNGNASPEKLIEISPDLPPAASLPLKDTTNMLIDLGEEGPAEATPTLRPPPGFEAFMNLLD
ncbi:P-loop containing nucleoside triphosphate hydrolase protein [Aaosphaeria arxii CBS 175.79]|uniref:P-loop containing nucleoside triphosphate hydrolase protein n=1 Tax=Aaosphaeria arxii CBS 175.79 TaxID=1450172 RepID=A0A6A5XNB5_9PLEO|nr:P-loop containing nucleoside triphosphate hydrolase protein [Aaosphaeria arxii CBS 175.79]KAF2014622.1 P-loop containing nucleoside triphosphate hydrolase protein [Aaosphaeria arxii CBS 175.79]